MISSSEAHVVSRDLNPTATSRLRFYGVVILATYWSLLLVLRVLAFDTLLRARTEAARRLPLLVTGYTTIAVGVLAEIAFFFLLTALALVVLRGARNRTAPRAVVSALGLAHFPLLLWVAVMLVHSGLLMGSGTQADVFALMGRGAAGPLKGSLLLAQAVALLVAPKLLVRLADARPWPAIAACTCLGLAVTATLVAGGL